MDYFGLQTRLTGRRGRGRRRKGRKGGRGRGRRRKGRKGGGGGGGGRESKSKVWILVYMTLV